MFELEIDKERLRRLESTFGNGSQAIEKIINSALRKVGNKIRNYQKKEIKSRYDIQDSFVNNQSLSLKKSEGTLELLGLNKRQGIENFYTSLRKPSKGKLRVSVIKATGKKESANMFWAFYKTGTTSLGIYQRGDDGNMVRVRSLSIYQMGLQIEDKAGAELQRLFGKEIDKGIEEWLDKL